MESLSPLPTLEVTLDVQSKEYDLPRVQNSGKADWWVKKFAPLLEAQCECYLCKLGVWFLLFLKWRLY